MMRIMMAIMIAIMTGTDIVRIMIVNTGKGGGEFGNGWGMV